MPDYFDTASNVVDRPRSRIGLEQKFWREEPPVFNELGKMIKGGMFPHQQAWWNLPNFFKVLVGGYGSGKTLIESKRALALAIQNAPVPIGTVSPSFPVARKTIIETIYSLCVGKQTIFGKDVFRFQYNKTFHEFVIYFHGRTARIYCMSGDDPDSLRGPNLGAAVIDEPFIQPQAVFDQMVARVRHPDSVMSEICLGGTPEQMNWGWDLCVGDLKQTNDVGLVQASTRLNLALDPSYVRRLEGVLTTKAAQAYIEGSFVNLSEGLMYYGFQGMGSANVREFENIPDGAELGAGMDFNVDPMTSGIFWKLGNHMHFFDEIELPNADTEYMCSTLVERYCKPDAKVKLYNIYPDQTGNNRSTKSPGGKSDFWYIRAAGFNVCAPSQNPPVKDRYNAVNGKFSPKQGAPTLTVSSKCKKFIKYLSIVSHEGKNTEAQKPMIHLLDACSYPVYYLFPVSKETVTMHKLSGF